MHQPFADFAVRTRADGRLTLRVGRQEMSYGSERLVSVREGTNNRRAFDAVRLLYQQGSVRVDAFFASPVKVDRGAFDDEHIPNFWFWGSYATVPFPGLPGITLDFYYLGLHNPRAVFSQGVGREERHTIGTRFFGTLGHWDVNHDDGIYTPGGSVIYRDDPSFARFVGTDLSVVIGWQATRHINVSAGYTLFRGPFHSLERWRG